MIDADTGDEAETERERERERRRPVIDPDFKR